VLRAKLGAVTAKERLQAWVEELSEPAAERALKLVEKEGEDKPESIIDDWGDLDAQLDGAAGDLMARLAEEEAAAGLEPW
jgi:hypothetical protein